jgi:hypothetical protein
MSSPRIADRRGRRRTGFVGGEGLVAALGGRGKRSMWWFSLIMTILQDPHKISNPS